MPPIKNWSRVDRRGYEYAWQNSVSGQEVRIVKEPAWDSPWLAEVYANGHIGADQLTFIEQDSNGGWVKKKAVEWMREHPEGLQ